MPAPVPTAAQQMQALMTGQWVTASLHTATILGIADLLDEKPWSVQDLARATQTNPDALRRLLRALVAQGVFAEQEDGGFTQTELSAFLRRDASPSLRSFLLMTGHETWSQPWGHLLHSVRTGESAFSKVHGVELFEYMKRESPFVEIFDQTMTEGSSRAANELVSAYDFSTFGTIVDVGGGQGLLLSAILKAHRGARGILVDLPHVLETAHSLVEEQGVADRCQLVGSSFFESVPAGGDAYVLKWILHDWGDEDAIQILRTIRAAIPRSGRLIVFDRVLSERIIAGDVVSQGHTLADLNMLVNVTGRERTEAQFRQLLSTGGFTLESVRSLPSGLGIIEGLPA